MTGLTDTTICRYHHLNHHALFGGGGYRSSAMAIMKKLWQRYGKATAN